MLLRRLKVSGLLSFGPKEVDLPMAPLNGLVGPNGSGKSNLLEAVSLLQAAPRTISEPIARRGGLKEFLWKGPNALDTIAMECTVSFPPSGALKHVLNIASRAGRTVVADERVEPLDDRLRERNGRSYRLSFEDGMFDETTRVTGSFLSKIHQSPPITEFSGFAKPEASFLYYSSPDYPELWHLRKSYEDIRLYRNWSFGPYAKLRIPCNAHGRSDFLDEGAENLPLILSQFYGEHKKAFLDSLRNLYDGIIDFQCPVTGGTVGLFLEEAGNRSIPATLLSDGTLRYLCLLAVLLHPKPPPLICIEEPELGLHPDLLPTLCDLMVDASSRSQLIVTTHSDVLVDALTDQPESVVVCEKHDGQTEMRRLDREDLSKWLEEYRLGELWTSGELGGNRW